ncbi:MAG: Gfo/Idh/MocA family oxidoreductase [Planctomycetota bacterium]|nr:Gfo/Idh/MocA family oxidoreductase [Planctomycetota bacterium]
MKQIKVGTIGYGGAFNMGKHHLNDMMKNKGFVPAAVCDLDAKRLETAQTDFPGIQTYTDVDEMLRKSDVELLAIILPHNVHAKVAIQCMNAGRHVVVEKPFAITVKECDAMIAAGKKHKVVCSTFHNRHWDSNILTIKKHLHKIGRPFRWESYAGHYGEPGTWWRSYKDISGGVIYDWGAHFCEWMLQVMDYEMLEINGYQVKEVWKKFTNEDELEAVVRFKGNAVGSHVASTVSITGKDQIRIVGTKGAIVASHGSCDVYLKDKDNHTVKTSVKMEPAQNSEYYKNVHDHLFHGKKLVITPEWARRVIQILDYAGQSSEKGTGIKAKYK